MNYVFRKASELDIELLIKYKSASIFDYAKDLTVDEENKISNYIKTNIPKDLKDYKMILVDNEIVGCLLVNKIDDGYLLNELYVEKKYRGQGIGTKIISDLKKEYNPIYLYVYKENKRAIKLYNKLGFSIKEETRDRYYMKTGD